MNYLDTSLAFLLTALLFAGCTPSERPSGEEAGGSQTDSGETRGEEATATEPTEEEERTGEGELTDAFFETSAEGPMPGPRRYEFPSDFRIRMERGECDSVCPRYAVSVNAVGRVVFDADPKLPGTQTVKKDVPEEKVARLWNAIQERGLFDLTSRELFDQCVEYQPKKQIIELSIRGGGRQVDLLHYRGCLGSVFDGLTEVEQRLESVTGAPALYREFSAGTR